MSRAPIHRTRLHRTRLQAGLLLLLAGCAAPRLELPLAVRHHPEVVVRPDGSLLPLFLGSEPEIGVCVRVEATTDTSTWRARLTVDGRPATAAPVAAAARAGRVVCFDGRVPPALGDGREAALCAVLEDRFDGARWRLPCRQVVVRRDDAGYRALLDREARLMSELRGLTAAVIAARVDRLSAAAAQASYPLLAVRQQLIAVYFLRLEGGARNLEQARRRLSALPSWLDRPAAGAVAAQAALAAAALEQTAPDGDSPAAYGATLEAWRLLAEAERRFETTADGLRLTATIRQSDLLAREGLAGEAADRLRAALDDCERSDCRAAARRYAKGQLSWLVLLDPFARRDVLEEAASSLEAVVAETGSSEYETLDRANQLLNLAYLRLRLGEDPGAAMAAAGELLAAAGFGAGRAELLRAWRSLLGALAALGDGRAEDALRICREVAGAADPQLAAAAASCEGRARRRLGDLPGAADAFARALSLHALAGFGPAAAGFALGPGPRAEDYQRLARAEIELGRVDRAWALMEELDALAGRERERRRCRDAAADPETAARWRAIDRESAAILRQLAALEAPASAARRGDLRTVRRALRQRWRELQRDWPGCAAAAPRPDRRPAFRAFALEDEIVLLRRQGNGRTLVARRQPMPRHRLLEIVERVERAMAQRGLDRDAWKALLAPVAAALVPERPEDLAAITFYRLHGPLQGIPLAALPLPGRGSAAPPWLIDATVPALLPAGSGPAAAAAGARSAAAGPPVFVVDPAANLPGASALVPFYRRRFPGARILEGPAATREALGRALAGSGWLHVDAHGRFHGAFPELSAIELHRSALAWPELADLAAPWAFANLSGCLTGKWRFTPDSGRFGLAGLLAQVGVRWVIASRSPLDDRFAADLNRAFYAAVANGDAVPPAYGGALRELAGRYPPPVWAAAMVLAGGGESRGERTR